MTMIIQVQLFLEKNEIITWDDNDGELLKSRLLAKVI